MQDQERVQWCAEACMEETTCMWTSSCCRISEWEREEPFMTNSCDSGCLTHEREHEEPITD